VIQAMVLIDSSDTVCYQSSIVTMYVSCTVSETVPFVCEVTIYSHE